jgi:uncharacterized protein YjiS (DUF1127 family)
MSMNMTASPIGVAMPAAASAKREGFLSRLYKAMISGRELQAQRVVRRYLANMSDAQLTDLGFTAEEIRRTRAAPQLPMSYWI